MSTGDQPQVSVTAHREFERERERHFDRQRALEHALARASHTASPQTIVEAAELFYTFLQSGQTHVDASAEAVSRAVDASPYGAGVDAFGRSVEV